MKEYKQKLIDTIINRHLINGAASVRYDHGTITARFNNHEVVEKV